MSNRIYKIAEDIFFSAAIFRISKGDKDIKLSNKEAELLEMLCDEAGTVIPRSKLQDALWPNQDNTDTNLNRQILSLRRKLESFGLMDAIDTIPRVGYMFCAPIELAGESEEPAPAEEIQAPTPSPAPQARRQYTRRKYDRYFSPKRILLFALLLVSLTSLALVIYNYATANTLRTINLGQISLYMTSETEKALNVKIDSLTHLIKPVSRKADEQISILVGKEAISYFSINNSSRKLSENIFLLRSGHPVAEEVQCVITTMNQQGNNVSNNYYNNQETTVRYHRDCQAPDNWVEMTRKSKYIVTMNREIVVATVIATDNQGKTLFNLDSVGDLERDNGDISVEIKNTIVNFIDQQALTNNAMVATLVAALTPPKQKAKFIQLPGGIYLSSYLGGVITWPSHGNTKVIQRNDF
ncbi:winged helix-turn-helix domain-containing protein [Aeromonas veronii]|uniref:winged helix-turn-helix domain-containing protein n=1 Tax=Aeromonas veronii TaxID=654 RepID=UPI0011194507|nr:winged helix-turn-helix domain-containing protein [Aeromonas veronii]QGW98029.1 winged helix-turn-helix transcriptional regulator [Aeromonas veronii]TNI10441.1 winged helix family transcriptional regulator [Aeromonas veronii]